MNARCEPVYFGDESKKIILGDALTELKKLSSESVDLIFADPPYGMTQENFEKTVSFRWQWAKKGYDDIEVYKEDLLKTEFKIIEEE